MVKDSLQITFQRTFSVESDEEDDPTEQWFANMEEDVKLAKEEEQALYPEEEVPVKVCNLLVRS